MSELLEFIQTYGFSIVLCVYLLIQSEKVRQETRSDSSKWCDAINRNTSVIERLLDKIDQK